MQPDPATDMAVKMGAGLVTELFKSAMAGLKSATTKLADKGGEHDIFGTAAGRYAHEMNKNYDAMRVLGMNRPVALRSIYTRVNVLERITAYHRATAEDLDRLFDKDLRLFTKTRETTDGITCVNSYQKIVLLGKPGSGKTTFLKYVLLRALDGALSPKCLPIFISLKDWSDSRVPLDKYVAKQFAVCHLPRTTLLVRRLLRTGKCLLLLDGLDEVIGNYRRALAEVRNFTEQYPHCRYILSCRIAAYNYVFEKFTEIEIADFNADQTKTFVKNWFYENPKKANLCIEQLFSSSTIRELSSNPLLLTMLCLAFDETISFPRNRSELYKEGIDALMKKWDASRDIIRPEIYKNLSLRRKESLLSRIAASTFQQGQYFIKEKVLESLIEDYIQHLTVAEQHPEECDARAILKGMEAQHGILIERAREVYSFSHLTFHEYFTARFIVDNAREGTLAGLVDHLYEDHWREVFLMVTTMLDNADDFLLLMDKDIKKWAQIYLGGYLRDLQAYSLNPTSPHGEAVKTAFAIYYGLQTSPHAALQQLRRPLEIARLLEPTVFAEVGSGRAVIESAINTNAIDWFEIEPVTIRTIEVYLKAVALLLECLHSECYASKPVVDSIRSKLFYTDASNQAL